MSKEWNRQETAFLQMLRYDLFNTPTRFPKGVDWYKEFCELRAQNVIGLSEKSLEKALLSGAFIPVDRSLTLPASWRRRMRQCGERFHAMLEVQKRVVDLLTDGDIPFVVLKGACAASFYPVPERRAMNDIDILVEPENVGMTRELMSAQGFVPEHADNRHTEYRYEDVVVEIHDRFSLDGVSVNGERLDEIFFGEIRHPDYITLYGCTFPSLSHRSHGLCLLDHMKHHLSEGLGFRHYLDWVMYADACVDDTFWNEELKGEAERFGLATFASVMTRAAQIYLGLPRENRTWCGGADRKTCHDFLQYLFESGDFGYKDSQSNMITNMLFNAGTYGLIGNMQREGEMQWTVLDRYPLLRPFAWIYKIFRYINRFFKLEHPVRQFREAYKKAAKRRSLLRRLGVYNAGN